MGTTRSTDRIDEKYVQNFIQIISREKKSLGRHWNRMEDDILTCYATEGAVRIVTSFYYNLHQS
jgi:hypothetical protein